MGPDTPHVIVPDFSLLAIGCIALILYEYLLTFDRELRVIWGRKFTIPTFLFLFNRYLALLFTLTIGLTIVVPWNLKDDKLCALAFASLRTHTINNGKWAWTALILLLGFVPIIVNIVFLVQTVVFALPRPLVGCAYKEPSGLLPQGSHLWTDGGVFFAKSKPGEACKANVCLLVGIAVQTCGLCGSLVVLGITWYRTIGGLRPTNMGTCARPSLARRLLRDGTTYFVAATVANALMMYTEVVHHVYLSTVVTTFQSVLTSRFILNLRLVDYTLGYLTAASDGGIGVGRDSLHFDDPSWSTSPFGNIGAPLDIEGENEHEEDDMGVHGLESGEEHVQLPAHILASFKMHTNVLPLQDVEVA